MRSRLSAEARKGAESKGKNRVAPAVRPPRLHAGRRRRPGKQTEEMLHTNLLSEEPTLVWCPPASMYSCAAPDEEPTASRAKLTTEALTFLTPNTKAWATCVLVACFGLFKEMPCFWHNGN